MTSDRRFGRVCPYIFCPFPIPFRCFIIYGAIFVFFLSCPLCSTTISRKRTHRHFRTKLMLIAARSSTTTQGLHSFKFILVNKAIHNILWLLLSVAKDVNQSINQSSSLHRQGMFSTHTHTHTHTQKKNTKKTEHTQNKLA